MYKLTLRNLLANRVRFALTLLGVTLAVSFVVSAFVLGDGLRRTFTDLSRDITAGVDLEVRPVAEFGDPPPLPFDSVETVASVDGVAAAVGILTAPDDSVRPIRSDGTGLPSSGPPQIAMAWVDNSDLSSFSIEEGSPPGSGEFVMDFDAARRHGFEIGGTYQFVTPTGRWDLVMSGTSRFGADNATVGAVLMQMNAEQAPQIFGLDGVSGVSVDLEPGADPETVVAQVSAALPGVEILDSAALTAEVEGEFNSQIDLIGNILLGFGGVSLFVSVFIIYNTFAIVLSQRTRELALLRAIGAAPRQVGTSVVGEALAVGIAASIAGLAGGVAVARGLEALFGLLGASLPDLPTVLAARTVIAAVVIGVGVTLVAALGPARK
ncbi:MAG TPA: ABC transporter permease, partial [Acidimicrobiales bacterium]|nr:ABC transporter permease [Acidimicrobiales bacterium]